MKGTYLGEFEELVLLVVAAQNQDAYGISVMEEIKSEIGRSVNISAVHSSLRRIETKGFVKSEMGGATSERGGRRKRYFRITQGGLAVLNLIKEQRNQLWNRVPDFSLQIG